MNRLIVKRKKDLVTAYLKKKQNKDTLIIKITAEFNCCGSVYGSVDLKPIGDIKEFYAFKLGEVWLGEKKQNKV